MLTTWGYVISSLVGLAAYIYIAWCLHVMAKKRALRRPWLAYVPILQFYTLCRVIGKGIGWFIMCIIPVLDIVIFIIIVFKLARECGRSWIYGLLLLVPLVNFVALWVLAHGSLTPPEMRAHARPGF